MMGGVAAVGRSHMNGLLLFRKKKTKRLVNATVSEIHFTFKRIEKTIEQTTGTMH